MAARRGERGLRHAPAGDCGGPSGFGNCYGYEVNANASLPGRPAVIDQLFGAGHAIMLGFDAWFRAWTTQEERLVLNGVLYPTGSAIPAGTTLLNRTAGPLHASSPAAPLSPGDLPRVEPRPLRATRSTGLRFFTSRTS